MPEAEVTLRLAFYLLALPDSQDVAEVAIDGAQVRVHRAEVFPIAAFLLDMGWKQVRQMGKNDWQGWYERGGQRLKIQARPGMGDVVVTVGAKRVRAECKGGPLVKKPGSREYPILRGALGQVITVEQVDANDIPIVAVPHSPGFANSPIGGERLHLSSVQEFRLCWWAGMGLWMGWIYADPRNYALLPSVLDRVFRREL